MIDSPENTSKYSQDEKRLLQLLLFYCIGVSICRLFGANMRYIAWMDWGIYRNDLLARLPFYLIPVIALVWLNLKQCSRAGLFYTASISFLGILDHGYAAYISLRWGLPFFQLTGREPPVRMNVLIASILAVVFSILIFNIFRLSKRLYTLKNQEYQTSNALKILLVIPLFQRALS